VTQGSVKAPDDYVYYKMKNTLTKLNLFKCEYIQ